MKRGLLVLAAAFALAAAGYLLCPRPELEAAYPQSRAFFDSQGRLLRLTLADDDRYRLHCPLKQMEPRLIQATLLYEDKDFYRHPGVDVLALARAFWTTYISRRPAGRGVHHRHAGGPAALAPLKRAPCPASCTRSCGPCSSRAIMTRTASWRPT